MSEDVSSLDSSGVEEFGFSWRSAQGFAFLSFLVEWSSRWWSKEFSSELTCRRFISAFWSPFRRYGLSWCFWFCGARKWLGEVPLVFVLSIIVVVNPVSPYPKHGKRKKCLILGSRAFRLDESCSLDARFLPTSFLIGEGTTCVGVGWSTGFCKWLGRVYWKSSSSGAAGARVSSSGMNLRLAPDFNENFMSWFVVAGPGSKSNSVLLIAKGLGLFFFLVSSVGGSESSSSSVLLESIIWKSVKPSGNSGLRQLLSCSRWLGVTSSICGDSEPFWSFCINPCSSCDLPKC